MRTLIDGYNLMFAGGLLGQRFGPDGFRKVRHRFLNDLAAALDPVEAHLTTIVFDAATAPDGVPAQVRHKGLTVLFAVDSESADDRIEDLIAHHSSPKTLTVVSSDNRIRRAATRRRAKILSADQYWSQMDARKDRKPIASAPETDVRPEVPTAQESAYWQERFRDVAESSEAREALSRDPIFPTDEEIARIEREVDEEFRDGRGRR